MSVPIKYKRTRNRIQAIFKANATLWIILAGLIVYLPVLFPPSAWADDVSLTLKLNRTEATLADSIRMVVRLSGVRKSSARPQIKGLDFFTVIPGGTSSRMEIINGKYSSSIEYTYTIQPEKTGSFIIGPAEIKIKKKPISSNTVSLTISKKEPPTSANRGALFLSASLSSNEIFIEEQAIYTLKLYTQANVDDLSLDMPKAENLTFKQITKPAQYESEYNSQSYQVLEIKYALTASKEGVFGIRPARMHLTVLQPNRRGQRSFFDDPFFSFSTRRPRTLASEPVELNIRPLPEAGRPTDFSGLVGAFEIQSKLEPTHLKAGDSATLTVHLSGRGNVNRIPDLMIPEVEHIKVYADQPVLNENPDAKGLSGMKTMKWALVPEKEGNYAIPPLSVSYFDTQKREYRTIRTSPLSLSVLPGEKTETQIVVKPSPTNGQEESSKKEIEEIGRDILPAHSSIKDLYTGSPARTDGIAFWIMLLSPLFIYLIGFFTLKFQKKSLRAVSATRAKRAAKTFNQACRKSDLSANDLTDAVREYLNHRFKLSLGSLTSHEAKEIVESRGVGTETSEKLYALIQKLEDTIYTGKGKNSCELVEDVPGLIKQIEKEIK